MSRYQGYEHIAVSTTCEGKVAVVTLNRPTRRNAFTSQMGREIADVYAKLNADDAIHVVVCTGAGQAFCAGADLGGDNPFADRDEGSSVTSARDLGGVASLAVWKCNKVTIAAVNGAAVGVGATVILPMDFRITYSEAKVGFPFAARGIVTDAASSYFLPKIAGMSNALALTMTASILPARHKWLAPLWADVLDGPAEVLPRALELAADIAARCSVVSTALIKNMMWRAPLDPEQHHLLDSIGVYLTSQRDGQEGVKSFLEKRPPKFTDSIADPTIQGFLRMTRARL